MSVGLVFNLGDVIDLASRVAQLEAIETDELLDAIGTEVSHQTRRRIDEEKTSPGGEAWQALTPDYAAFKETKSSGGILEFEGHLLESIQHLVENNQVTVGSNHPGAAHHNFGGEEVGTNMPQREFLGLSDDNTGDLQDVINDFLDRALNTALTES